MRRQKGTNYMKWILANKKEYISKVKLNTKFFTLHQLLTPTNPSLLEDI